METKVKDQTGRAARLAKLGFSIAAKNLDDILNRKRKLALAYEHYRFVTPQNVSKFNKKLWDTTGKRLDDPVNMEYQVLAFTPIKDYAAVPPDSVLASLEVAQERKCFDDYEVAYIKNVKDPLLFGRVDGSDSRFFIDQWDDDVKIDDLLKENEG